MATTEETEWKLLCVVRGYHAYKDVWDPVLEDEFRTKHQKHNSHDKYAMAVVPVDAKVEMVVGHLPREIAKECCLFVYHGGSITGIVKGKRRRTKEPCGGMEIPCELTFRHKSRKILNKLQLCISQKYEFNA